MNEYLLPDNYREMAQTQTIEEYRNYHNIFASSARNQIQWYIDHIREILNEMSFPCSDTLDDKQKRRVRRLQKKRDEQLAALNLSEIIIKENVNNLLNAMAGSVNHKWDDCNLGEIVGFQSDTIKCSEDLIPLPIQSLYYTVILTYGYLIQHAINTMILKIRVAAIDKTSQKEIIMYLRRMSRKMACIEADTGCLGEIKEMVADKTTIKPNNQDELAENIISGFKQYLKRHKREIPDYIKVPGVPTIVKMFNRWNQYNKSSKDAQEKRKEDEPYPRYREILYGSDKYVTDWGEKIFAPTYIKMKIAKQKQKEEKKGKKKIDALDRWKIRGEKGEELIDLVCATENSDIYFDEP